MSTDTDQALRTSLPRLATVVRYDLPASVVVFLVALPLSLGIAVASNALVEVGLIAAVVGGVVAGVLGGSNLQVSGPAAGLTVVVVETIDKFGWRGACFITAAAGVLQIVFGLSRIARGALAIAPVVVYAMLAGIGITIALQQVHVLLGGSSHSTAVQNIAALPQQLLDVHGEAVVIGCAVIAIMVGWRWMPPRVRVIPGPLVAVLGGTALAFALPGDADRVRLDGSLFDAVGLPEIPDQSWGVIALSVLTIALIASVESLLSAVAVDRMAGGSRTNFDRELLGQGAANLTSGLLGGLPVTGVIVRSATNVQAGARTRASGVLHGIWVLVFAVALVGMVQQIPRAALAGLLIVVGVQLVKLAHIKLAHRTGDLAVYAITIAGVVLLNLLEGVLIGLEVAFALLLWRVVRVAVAASAIDSRRWLVTIDGVCTFLALPKLTKELAKIPAGAAVTLEMTVDFLDHAACEALEEWMRGHRADGGSVECVEMGSARMANAGSGPPTRGHGRRILNDVLGPRRRTGARVDPIVAGIATYHRSHAHVMRPHLGEMLDGQEPDALFLNCADSRIVPNVITNSGPGDLFTVRNVGNLIPAHGRDASMEAAIVYALDKLDVRSVVACGHSGCGAMDALYREAVTGSGLDDWLAHARSSLAAFHGGHRVGRAAAAAGFGPIDQLGMVNVAVQLETLYAHPVVRRGVEERGVVLSGLFFDIATARVVEVTVDGIAEIDDLNHPVAEPQPA
ncbi:SulP family inorganic anion transporter [Nocardia crassostreae]|uniref:SulP family inorganic anion transporter n=1 Tax=Nocardia crassostreae TaxID=53428 RepID=UPI000829A37C|nr:bifunctional SulP family inorganic anion transporter/carbonic anhydrase [Nocardia crassostreae]